MAVFQRILVATDGSSSCGPVVDAALSLASMVGARVIALSVAAQPDALDADILSAPDPIGAAEEATMALTRHDVAVAERTAAHVAEAVAARARARGLDAVALAWEGSAGEAIVEAAAAEDADLIVVGSHCRGSMGRMLHGSVSDHVAHHAHRPVLVIPGA